MSHLTSAQQAAVAARGNVLVIAGAGTGKTKTLVERCLNCLTDEKPPASLNEILVVTFTEAAATEIRQRIRSRLEQELGREPTNLRWHEQLAIFEIAHIGTLHSFCLQLVRQHFHELRLDPQLTVLSEEESRLLAEETLDRIFQNHYAGSGEASESVRQLIQSHGRGSDKSIRALVLKIHHYAQTLPDPAGWFRGQLDSFANPKPELWETWLRQAVNDWRAEWREQLRAASVPQFAGCLSALDALSPEGSRTNAASTLEIISASAKNRPRGKKTPKSLEDFFDEAAFLLSLAIASDKSDPLAEDWEWVRFKMATLLQLAEEFRELYSAAKREQGSLDFHDLEQFALRLLWDGGQNQPTRIACEWREKLRFVFVDEYQDINAAQDKIITALSRDGANANRFLVGDIKQSIYRFRLANPRIFQDYARTWRGHPGTTIPLTENFRSREGLLDFVNALFGFLMREQIGPVAYDEQAQLRFGAPAARSALARAADSKPRVELCLRLKSGAGGEPNNEGSDSNGAIAELRESEKEARLIALRLRELKNEGHQIWDEDAARFRAVEWSDIAVLLRSPANKAESYAKEFSRLNVPLAISRGSFYESIEVSDVLNLLKLIDNPLQDVPLLAVLRSPLVGLSLNELAAIRAAAPRLNFWNALRHWQTASAESISSENASDKVSAFLNRYARWRRLARLMSLSKCVETVLRETHYLEWLLTQPRGAQREANVRRLIEMIREFDQFQRQGLFRFLRFVDAQTAAEIEPEVPSVAEANAVRLISIHQSKGLEFPVVVLADLAKPFNFSDLHAEIILDEEYGLCPQVKPPHTGTRYPSLAHWLARKRQKKETLSEELRLLYVATTRARDTLILTASVPEKKFESEWNGKKPHGAALLSARSYADWIGAWFSESGPGADAQQSGASPLLRWKTIRDEALDLPDETGAGSQPKETWQPMDAGAWEALRARLEWKYPFPEATLTAAKASVSALRRKAGEQPESEARDLAPPVQPARAFESRRSDKFSSDVGTAHHKFLQFISLERADHVSHLRQEAERLTQAQQLSAEDCALLNLDALAAFWKSELGGRIRAQADNVRRELAFTARFSAKEIARLTGGGDSALSEDEFVVVQGVADLVVQLPREIWIVDFKTDQVDASNIEKKAKLYAPQLKLYARALSRIYNRPVTECHLHFLSSGATVAIQPGEMVEQNCSYVAGSSGN